MFERREYAWKRIQAGFVVAGMLLAFVALTGRAAGGDAGSDRAAVARHIVSKAGVRRGICLDLGCGDAGLAIELAKQTDLWIQCTDPDEKVIVEARRAIDAAGLYGTRVVADRGKLDRIGYMDHFANLIICGDEFAGGKETLDFKELFRVLNPNGAAFIGRSAGAAGKALSRADLEGWLKAAGITSYEMIEENGVWARITKPRRAEWDEWTHMCNNPANTFSSMDTAAVPPFRLQWYHTSPPAQAHGSMLLAGGRQFLLGYGWPARPEMRPSKTTPSIHAYDAYNGIELWSRMGVEELPIDMSLTHYSPVKSSSDAVATNDALYVLGGKELHVFDPATGEIVKSFPIPQKIREGIEDDLNADWSPPAWVSENAQRNRLNKRFRKGPPIWLYIARVDGLLLCAVGPSPLVGNVGQARGGRFGWCQAMFAMDPKSGEVSWMMLAKLWTNSLTVGEGRVFFLDHEYVLHSVDVKTGKDVWAGNEPAFEGEIVPWLTTYYRGKLWIMYNDLKLGKGSAYNRRVLVFSAEDGRSLFKPEFHKVLGELTFTAGMVLGSKGHAPVPMVAVDAETGKALWSGKKPGGRCGPPTSTPGYFVSGGGSPGVMDLKSWKMKMTIPVGTRTTCAWPMTPANGMLYVPAPGCGCLNEFRGSFSMIPGTNPAADAEGRFVKGPAFGKEIGKFDGPTPWRTFRGDSKHSGRVPGRLRASMRMAWTCTLPARPGQLAVADGIVFCGSADRKVYALGAESGDIMWRYVAEGAVRIAPFLWEGRVYVGDDGGWVHCLNAQDGELIWKFRAALADDRIMFHGRPASRWPVVGGVLVHEDTAYFPAGFFPMDRSAAYALDARTGELKWEQVYELYSKTTGSAFPAGGALALCGSNLLIPSSGGLTRTIDLGDASHRVKSIRGKSYGSQVMVVVDKGSLVDKARGIGNSVVVRSPILELTHANYVDRKMALPIVTDTFVYLLDGRTLNAHTREVCQIGGGSVTKAKAKYRTPPEWTVQEGVRMTAIIMAGNVLLSGSERGVYATSTGEGEHMIEEGGQELWSADVPGEVTDLAFHGGRLFAACKSGDIVCFK